MKKIVATLLALCLMLCATIPHIIIRNREKPKNLPLYEEPSAVESVMNRY